MKPTAIVTSDIHIPHKTSHQPRCRTDSYWEAFTKKIKFIRKLQKKYDNIPILDAGDLCDRSRLDPEVEAWSIRNLPNDIITIPGNHELPSHNLNYLDKSSLSVIEAGIKDFEISDKEEVTQIEKYPNIYNVYGFPYGSELDYKIIYSRRSKRNIALIHTMVYPPKEKPKSNKIEYSDGLKLLKKMKEFDLIVTGHNHQSFIVEYKGRILINPGSLMRSTADQKNYQPRVFLWCAKNNSIVPVDIPIESDVITDQYLRNKEAEDDRMSGFIESLNVKGKEISFEKKMEVFFEDNEVKPSVKSIIMEAMK